MARDYKNSSRARAAAKPRPKPKSRPKQGTPAPIWFLAGLALGLGAALAVQAYHVQLAPRLLSPVAAVAEPAPDAKTPTSDNRPRFEFYRILPEMEVVVPEEEERALTAKPKPPAAATPPTPSKPAPSKERYLLQVASFQQHAEADRLKAQLALIGLQATIQTVEIHGGQTWHRVRVGPFSDRDEIASVRQRLQANGIEAVLLKLSG
jgi:cell division protein FtsN